MTKHTSHATKLKYLEQSRLWRDSPVFTSAECRTLLRAKGVELAPNCVRAFLATLVYRGLLRKETQHIGGQGSRVTYQRAAQNQMTVPWRRVSNAVLGIIEPVGPLEWAQ